MAEAQWDPAAVIARAKELIHTSNYEKVGEARANVDAEIDEWVRAAQALHEGTSERGLAAARIAEAWGLYAQLEIELRQFKQATKVFESAVGCAVTRDSTALWLQYAAFCVDRKKLSNARKVFARAIYAVPEAEREQVWVRFHAFVREHIDPNVTLESLQAQMRAALPGTSSIRASPTNGTALPNDQQVANERTNAAASVATSAAVDVTAAPTTVITPSPISSGVDKPAETPAVGVDGAASIAQTSSTDSSEAAPPAGGDAVEHPAETAEGTTAIPVVSVDVNIDANRSAPADKEVKKTEVAPELVVDGDSALAFVDKTGQELVPAELVKPVDSDPSSTKRTGPADGANDKGANKRAKLDTESLSPTQTGVKAEPLEEPSDFLLQVPKTLPHIAECPHLLFDPPTNEDGGINKAAASELPNELVERLSDALSDSAVFQGVRELCTNQEQRDLDMLHRWQELVRMQMKERTELYARQAEAEEQHGFEDTRGLIELKMKHLEQRHEFVNRCLTSQRQFIEICAMDRTNALRAQQISLENMKIPEMAVTSDPARVHQQRAIVSVILEAEKLWREEQSAATTGTSSKMEPAGGHGEAGPGPSSQPFNDGRPSGRDSLDSSSSHSAGTRSGGYNGGGGYNRGNSMRGGRGGGYPRRDGGRGGFRRDDSRPYAGRGGNDRYRRDPRRDPRKLFYENRDAVPSSRPAAPAFDSSNVGGPAPARFEPPQRPPRLQEEYDPYEPQYHRAPRQQEPPAYYQGQQPPPQQQLPSHRHQEQPPPVQYAPSPDSYDAYDRRRESAPPAGAPYAPQAPAPSAFVAPDRYPQDPRRPRSNDRYGGPPQAAGGPADWQRLAPHPSQYRQERQEPPQQQQQQQQQYRRREPPQTNDRVVEYSVGVLSEGEYRQPQNDAHLSRYGGGPPSAATGRAPPVGYASQAPPPHQQQQQRGYPRSQDIGPGPSSQPPPYDAYSGYDYPPHQQQHQQPPNGGRGAPSFDGPRGFGNGRGGFVPQQQRQPYPQQQQYQQPPPASSFGYQSSGLRSQNRQGYGRGRGGGRRGGGPRSFRR